VSELFPSGGQQRFHCKPFSGRGAGSEEQVDVFNKSNNIICKNINKFLRIPAIFLRINYK
jgi:hypothetical protein